LKLLCQNDTAARFSLSFRAERGIHDTKASLLNSAALTWILLPPKSGGIRMTITPAFTSSRKMKKPPFLTEAFRCAEH